MPLIYANLAISLVNVRSSPFMSKTRHPEREVCRTEYLWVVQYTDNLIGPITTRIMLLEFGIRATLVRSFISNKLGAYNLYAYLCCIGPISQLVQTVIIELSLYSIFNEIVIQFQFVQESYVIVDICTFLAAMGILQYQTLQGKLFFIVYVSCFIYCYCI